MRLKSLNSIQIYKKYLDKTIRASYNGRVVTGIMCGYDERFNICIIKSSSGWPYWVRGLDDIINSDYQHHNTTYEYVNSKAKIEIL